MKTLVKYLVLIFVAVGLAFPAGVAFAHKGAKKPEKKVNKSGIAIPGLNKGSNSASVSA